VDSDDQAYLRFEDIGKFFGSNHVLDSISLDVPRGEVLALLGPSGSGKTTLLRVLAGFETPDFGRILVEGQEVHRLPPAKRDFGMVFQSYALFPHRTVAGNIAFGLESAGWDKAKIASRIDELLEMVDLGGFGHRKITEISGGQQQRVALARALAPGPRILMLDEPLSNLDPSLRERTRRALGDILRKAGTTTLLVTHEQEEAFEIGDRVGVLHNGKLAQLATAEDVYERPATPFVASFIGHVSVLRGVVEEHQNQSGVEMYRVRLLGFHGAADWTATSDPEVEAADAARSAGSATPKALRAGDPVEVVVRPEALRLSGEKEIGDLSGRVLERRYTGPLTYYNVLLDMEDHHSEDSASQTDNPHSIAHRTIKVIGAPRAAEVGQRVFVRQRQRPLPRIFLRDGERG
jgi:ABC-type Fe3+/spermidine/putrescine transport system ATPase subunit